ncbi:MAG TPA: hypothetical protein VH877_03010 [Polyangia bacterium]|jgi:dipeptidyl aminopeptidase/acylaminoacyl peptidase|nr:hypothetical protein [Polyangia bacterium]
MGKRIELRDERRITSLKVSFCRPTWSPDGRLALEAEGRLGGIYLVDGKGRIEGRIGDGAEPSFSPDGEHLAFTRSEKDGRRSIWVCRLDAPEEARRLAGGQGAVWEHPAWSPDGRMVACVSDYGNSGGLRQVWALDAQYGDRRRVTCDPQRNDGHPSWSPDGRMVAFDGDDRADDAREVDVYVIDLQTGAITRLSDGTVATRRPRFVDRRCLIAERRSAEGPALVVLDRAKKRMYPVETAGSGDREPVVRLSPRRRHLQLAFVRRDDKEGRDAVWIAELRGLKVTDEAEAKKAEAAAKERQQLAAGLPVLPAPPPGATPPLPAGEDPNDRDDEPDEGESALG